MNRLAFSIFMIIILVAISCAIAQRQPLRKNNHVSALQDAVHPAQPATKISRNEGPSDPAPPSLQFAPSGISSSSNFISQFDSLVLDQQVFEAANSLNADPKTFRLALRKNADGTEIYRMRGMHVIINSDGDEWFLPDEL